jgi:hypothetical protein
MKIQRKDAEKEMKPGKLRRMRKSDIRAVRRVYSEATKSRIGSAVRTADVWDWLLNAATKTWLFKEPMLILDTNERVCGYLTGPSNSHSRFAEIVVKPTEVAQRSALGAIVKHAKKREWQDIELPLPWDDPFAVFLRQHLRAETVLSSGSTGGALMKIVDFPTLMKRLEPLFQSRWRAGTGSKRQIRIVSDIGKCMIQTSPTGVRVLDFATGNASAAYGVVAKIPSLWLSGLITGYYSAGDIVQRKEVSIPSDVFDELDMLFPSGWPFVYQGDNY